MKKEKIFVGPAAAALANFGLKRTLEIYDPTVVLVQNSRAARGRKDENV